MAHPQEIHDRLGEYQLLDVREGFEWDAGHVEGALHLPLAEVMAGGERGRLDPSRPVAVICRVGNRSELATLMLRARGFDAENVEGGMEAWEAAGLPFSASDGQPGRVA